MAECHYELQGEPHRKCKQGLNVEARCPSNNSKKCPLSGKFFIVPIESGVFDFELETVECPNCNTLCHAEFCGLLRCVFRCSGLYVESSSNNKNGINNNNSCNTKIFNSQECITVGDHYQLYSIKQIKQAKKGEEQLEPVSFRQLKVTVEKDIWDARKDGSQLKYCGICLNFIVDIED